MAAMPASLPAAAPALDHISWSGVTTYCACPRKFYYRYIERAPEEFVPAAMAFGGAFHRAVELVHEARLQCAPIPETDALLASYDRAWLEATTDAPEVMRAKDEDALALRETAQRMLSVYREHVVAAHEQSKGVEIIGIEHSERFRLLAYVPPIEMRLDLLELTADGDLIVTDVKTSRSRWNETKLQEALPQLVLYANGLMPLLRAVGAKRIVPRFVVVSKAKTPEVQTLQPQASQADVERLKRQVTEVWEGIQKEVFTQRTGWQCAQCPYKRRCLGA
jgi:putative RecB family exonuclease